MTFKQMRNDMETKCAEFENCNCCILGEISTSECYSCQDVKKLVSFYNIMFNTNYFVNSKGELEMGNENVKQGNGNVEQNYESDNQMVSHPKHYQLKNGLEAITVIEAITDGLVGIDAVDIGNAVKYLCRLGKKDDSLQEVEKAKWYLTDYIKRHKND